LELRHLEGELARARPERRARLDPRQARALRCGFAPTPDLAAGARDQIKAIERALAPWAAPYVNLHFAETSTDERTLWLEPAYQRLRQLRSAVDPDDIIRANHPITPGS
jgi:hypothetical protein